MDCDRCGDPSAGDYCDRCKMAIGLLRQQWTDTFGDLFEDMLPHIDQYFSELDFGETPSIEDVFGWALRKINPVFYRQQIREICYERFRPQLWERPTDDAIRETLGDEKYHRDRDEGRI